MATKRTLLNGIVNRVQLVGIELEGGWDAPVKGEQVVRDGSVEFDGQPTAPPEFRIDPATGNPTVIRVPKHPAYPKYAIGEIVSKPMQPSLDVIGEWVRKCYPQHVNHTCGLHVHMSFFHKLNYSRLMTPDYTPYMVEGIRDWAVKQDLRGDHPLWERLNNKDHRHCAHYFLGDNQVMVTRKDYQSRGKPHSRYTFINYCAKQHNTVECRGLCMFETADQAISAIMCVLDSTNRFLSKMRQREKTHAILVPEKPMISNEIHTIIR